ncbi:serine/threonine-protein phosphatase 7 long form homolog [Sorghum bicolor]|uniref:serine/threonine-protein phosphatase 7 long form homolog n=1 Tax=Sorghum bicolor TaxID=4558 RepID=UPI000B4251E3|nr:serine/threonine-protein phosphatase 7 long form homolog [Sorghum bicolor]|eukprot:XP_021304829.1 serine/threonine-protein phosphatase 7 long form homolog [Sorghum bicolor]
MSYRIRFVVGAITALVDRWRPETHSFHLPCGEMTVTLQDTQKILGLSVRGRPVIGRCRPDGWRARVEAFLGRPLPPEAPTQRTTGVPIAWLRQSFGNCPAHADQETVAYYCRAWILHLFGCVLFPDAIGDTASWMYLPCLTDWDTTGTYSWASGVLAYLYRSLCEACRRTASSSSVGGCVYLLQLWMWARLPVGRPIVDAPREWFAVGNPRHRPTFAHLWDQAKVAFSRTSRAYVQYANELDTLRPSMVNWEPYTANDALHLGVSSMYSEDEDLYLMICPLICFYAVEWHLPNRVARQFGLCQQWPVPPFDTSVELHKIDRQKQKKTFEFETLHRQYIEVWDQFHDNLYENEQPHTNYNFRAYLTWYLGVTRTRLKIQWTQADYAYLESSEDEDTSYDLAARQGTLIEAAPVLDRVGNAIKQSVLDIERFPRTGVDEHTLNNFLGRLARRLRRAAARCGCGTSAAMNVHVPQERQCNTPVVHGTSSLGGSGGQSSSRPTMDTFQSDDDEDEEGVAEERDYDELGLSQLPDAPSTQPTQVARRRRRSPCRYTPGTDALGHKGKGKTRRQ